MNYEKIENLGRFLFHLNPIVQDLEIADMRIGIYLHTINSTGLSDLYIRIWSGIHQEETDSEGLLYSGKLSYVVKDLQDVFLNKVLVEDDLVELYLNHKNQEKCFDSKITIAKNGNIISKKLKYEPVTGHLSKVLNNVSLNFDLMGFHSNFHEIADNLINDYNRNLDTDYTYKSEFGLGGRNPNESVLLGQQMKDKFEDSEKIWVNSGTLTDQINEDFYGLRMTYQFFIALRINEKLHFYLSPKMRIVYISKISWPTKSRCLFQLNFQKFEMKNNPDVFESIKFDADENGIREIV